MNARVIIIDQEPFSNRLAMFLTETDDQIVIAGRFCSAADASAFLERKSADLILWHLSAENFSALRVLRNTGCTAAVILLMHRINPDLMAQAIALGVSDCILMPCDPARLRHSIQNFLERERILRSDGELNQGMIDHLLHHPLPSESGVRLLPKGLSQRTLSMLEQAIPALEAISDWTVDAVHDTLINLAASLEVKNATLMWPVRIAAAGKLVTPGGAVELCHILGKDETLRRLRLGVEKLRAS